MRARCVASLLCVASVVVAAVLPGPTASAATRKVTVTPNTDLAAGDLLTIAGSGFTPSVSVGVCEAIVAGTPGPEDCGTAITLFTTDPSGGFSTATFAARRFLTVSGQQVDCASPGAACIIGAAEMNDISNSAVVAPISFKPATGTPRPDLIFKRRDTQQLLEDNQYFSAASAPQHKHLIASPGSWTYAVVVQNDGNVPDDLVLTMLNAPSPPYAVHVFIGYYNVTAAVTGSGLVLRGVPPGQSYTVGVGFTAAAGAGGSAVLTELKLSSGSAPELADYTQLGVEAPTTG